MKLIEMLFKDPTITAQEKVMALLQIHGAGLISHKEAREHLLGTD